VLHGGDGVAVAVVGEIFDGLGGERKREEDEECDDEMDSAWVLHAGDSFCGLRLRVIFKCNALICCLLRGIRQVKTTPDPNGSGVVDRKFNCSDLIRRGG
jgi:hypothetical protein